MFHIRLILRKLFSGPQFYVITITGLIIGFVSVVFVSIWLRDEFSYDSFHNKSNHIYRLTVEIEIEERGFHWDFARSFYGWLRNIKDDIPGIESMVRIGRWTEGVVKKDTEVWNDEIFYADSTFTDIFTLQFITGNPEKCLSEPGQVILSETMAKKYFGNKDPLGETLLLYCTRCIEKKPYKVTAVYRDLPSNAHVHFHIIASRDNPDEDLGWAYYYLLLDKNTSPVSLLDNFDSFAQKYIQDRSIILTPHLQKITDIHLTSSKERELERNGSMRQVSIIAGLALFVLFITMFNYFNLRYVSLLKEYKSIQIFRFTGAKNKNIYFQLLLESLIIGLLSSIISLALIYILHPYFNLLMGKDINAGKTVLFSTSLICLIGLIIISVISGTLPYMAIKISSVLKANNLYSTESSSAEIARYGSRSRLLKGLMSIQYISAFILIVSVIVVNSQLSFFMQQGLGNNKDKLINIYDMPCQVINKYQVLKQELLKSPLITDITASMEEPGYEIQDMMGFETTGISEENSRKQIFVNPVDDNFFSFYDIKIVAGNSFPKYNGNDSIPESFILNEKAVKYLGWTNDEAVGKPFRLRNPYTSRTPGKIVGVVSDFQPSSMTQEIKPYVFFQKSFWLFNAQVKYDTSKFAESIEVIKSTWADVYPDFQLQYEFVDNLYKNVYNKEVQLKKISLVLTLLAILLSAIGLFAVTGLAYQSRTKEIGVRKVNGATISEIIGWLLKDIILVVLISLCIAAPISYVLMNNWLKNYVYRMDLKSWIFLLGGLIIVSVALITVSWQTLRAARRNPVKALRYE